MPALERSRPSGPSLFYVLSALALAVLFVPLLVLAVSSFSESTWISEGTGPTGEVLGHWKNSWTLQWYAQVFQDPQILSSLKMSLWIGTWSTLLSTLLGTAAALALHRAQFPGKRAFEVLIHLPLMMPEIVLGLSLLIWFVFLKLTLGPLSMILAHTTFSLSYVIITVGARLDGLSPSYREAALDLGATPFQAFTRVTLPLIRPGILAGALMAFTLSFDDFLITFFTSGVGAETLPLRIYSTIRIGVSPMITALSTVLMGLTLVGLLLSLFRRV